MTTRPQTEQPITLSAAPRGWTGPLLPEQAVTFDLALANRSPAPLEITLLDGNPGTLVLRAYSDAGALLVEAALDDGHGGHGHEPNDRPVKTRILAAGAEVNTYLSLWDVTAPLPPGRYAFEVEQRGATTPIVVSNRVPFEITSARVDAAALDYESPTRMASLLAWTATRADGASPELLARFSETGNHERTFHGAALQGRVPAGARVAVSRIAPGGSGAWLGWIAVAAPGQIELFRHNNAAPAWRSGPIALAVSDALPVPRFPDRGHAVMLATGSRGGSPILAGAVVKESAAAPVPWVVPLAALPSRAAAVFGPSGPITLFFASDDGATSRVSRLDVDESGAVAAAEQLVRTTPNRVIGMVADMRAGQPPSVVVLESNRATPNRMALSRLPLSGAAPPVASFAPLAGWPLTVDQAGERPLEAAELVLEVALDGSIDIAIVDELGRLHAGKLDAAGLRLVRDPSHGRAHAAHFAALRDRERPGCFTDAGMIDRTGGH
jgi:hypothetical protein